MEGAGQRAPDTGPPHATAGERPLAQPLADSTADTPSALARFDDFMAGLEGRRPAVFLDYDGTLTPIVERPDLALLDEGVRATIRRLAALCPVAMVSGRDLDDVARHVGLEELVYAGSHGFDIRGPNLRTQIGVEFMPEIDAAEAELKTAMAGVTGALVERKRFAVAVHTRQVDPAAKSWVADAVAGIAGRNTRLRLTGGKEIFELRPAIPWDKGRAVLALLDTLGLAGGDTVPLYIGDDETDEDAFRALAERGAGQGFGIRVMDPPSPTLAGWSLHDTAEAGAFLARLADRLTAA